MKIKKRWKIVFSIVGIPGLFVYIILRLIAELLTIGGLFMYAATFNDTVEYKPVLLNKLFGK